MNDTSLVTIEQIESFVLSAGGMEFEGKTRKEKYAWLEKILWRFFYKTARKKNKHVIKSYAMKMTGYSDAQMTRLLSEFCKTKRVCVLESTKRASFKIRYTTCDVARLIETDNLHDRLSGQATRELFKRAYEIYNDTRYERLKDISISHLYNLRRRRQYISTLLTR